MKWNKNYDLSETGVVVGAPMNVDSGGWPVQDPEYVSRGAQEEAIKYETLQSVSKC